MSAIKERVDYFAKAKVQLTLNYPFFATLVYHLPLVEKPLSFFQRLGAPPTACVDGTRIYYYGEFVKGLTEKQRMGLLCHEVMHPALQHLWRRGNRDVECWLMATDYVVNDIILSTTNEKGEPAFELPPNGLHDKRFAGLSAEQVYAILYEEKKNGELSRDGEVLDGQMEGTIKDEKSGKGKKKGKGQGQGRGKGKGQGDGEDEQGGTPGGGSGRDGDGESEDDGDGPGGDGEAGFDQQEGEGDEHADHDYGCVHEVDGDLEEQWRGLLNEAAMVAKARGTLPGRLERMVEEANKPKVPWQQVVAHYLNEVSRDDYNMMQRDRRFQDIYFPDLHSNTTTVCAIVDTSGSIGQIELAAFAGEITGLLRCQGIASLRLMACDAEVTMDETLTPMDQLPKEFPGGGGTDFRPPFKRLMKDTNATSRPSLIIYLTDMYGTFPEQDIGIPVLWLAMCPAGRNVEDLPQPRYGQVIAYDPLTDEPWANAA
jgi:predicted metal-dependent peptidase